MTSNKYKVDLKSLFSRFTCEIVAGLGIEEYYFEDDAEAKSLHELAGNTFAESLETIITFHYPSTNRLLKFSFLPKSMDEFFRKVVSENLKMRRNDSTPRNDFLQWMIDLENTGDVIDEENVTVHAASLYLDGTETSSITLNIMVTTWLLIRRFKRN